MFANTRLAITIQLNIRNCKGLWISAKGTRRNALAQKSNQEEISGTRGHHFRKMIETSVTDQITSDARNCHGRMRVNPSRIQYQKPCERSANNIEMPIRSLIVTSPHPRAALENAELIPVLKPNL